jgi:3-oxoacyl-[acyl-carrier-protein] synthase III
MATRMTPFRFAGWGADVPPTVMDNAVLEEHFGVDEGWILEKTGIRERRVAAPHESTASLATNAARAALESANLAPRDIDVIALATTTPEQPIPHTAAFVGGELDMTCASFDLNTACSGFVYGLVMTGALLNSGPFDNALLIGAETFSRVLDPDDRATSVIFGDGAGAVVVTRDADVDSGVLASDLGCEGALTDLVGIRAGGSRQPSTPELVANRDHTLHMQGRAIFEFAVRTLVQSIDATLARASVNLDEVDWFVPHQANLRIIEAAGEKLGLDPEKVVLNIDRLGNTAAASIPIGLTEAAESDRLRHGDLVLLASIGAGMTWGTALIRW